MPSSLEYVNAAQIQKQYYLKNVLLLYIVYHLSCMTLDIFILCFTEPFDSLPADFLTVCEVGIDLPC